MLVLQGKQLIVFIYYYIFRNGHRKKDVCWRRTECFWVDHQLAAPPLVIRKYGSVFPLWLFLHSSFSFYVLSVQTCFSHSTPRQTAALQRSTPLYQKVFGKIWWNENILFSYLWRCTFFSHDMRREQSSARVCLMSALNLHLILSTENSPLFSSSFQCLSFSPPHPSGMVNLRAN